MRNLACIVIVLINILVASPVQSAGIEYLGTTGVDRSVNQPTFPPAGLDLLKTIAVNSKRFYIEVQNQSAQDIQVWRDDGAGTNLSVVILSGVGAAQQGGSWSSYTFKGRVRIYGAASGTPQISAFED